MNNSLVTIGITSYNAVNTVVRAVESAIAQTWRPIEIIVIDDCSTDTSFDVLTRLTDIYTEIRIFQNEKNSGVAVSRNRILQEAKGEFVVFFDDDDESLPNRISLQYKRITDYEKNYAHGAPVICHSARRVIYPNNEERIEHTMGEVENHVAPSGYTVAERILLGKKLKDGYGACPTCSQMSRLSTYRSICGFDEDLRRGEDTEFNIRLAKNGGHFVGIGSPLVVQTMTNTSEKSLQDEYLYMLKIMEKHRDVMDRVGQYEFCKQWVDLKFKYLLGNRMSFLVSLFVLIFSHPLLTFNRILGALPNITINNAFGRFHRKRGIAE